MKKKNRLTLVLIYSSIILLLVLQGFWLTNAYEKAYFDLRRETSGIFRNTVFALRDSLFARSVEKIPSDSADLPKEFTFTQRIDTLVRTGKTHKIQRQLATSSQVQIFISSGHKSDSIRAMISPIAARLQETVSKGGGSYVLRFKPDSLSVDSIQVSFEKALQLAGIDAATKVTHSSVPPAPFDVTFSKGNFLRKPAAVVEDNLPARAFSDELFSDWVRIDPIHRYSAVLSDFRPILLKGITPQILFSTFLTLVTIGAFVMLYRNIRSQQRLMELKNDFISNMTHELKTPIATVSVALEALKNFKGIDNPKLTSEYLDIAQHELNRLTMLTDKVLKTSLFEDRGVDFTPEPVDLQKIVSQVVNSLKLVFEKRKASINFETAGENFVVQGGVVHLTNVIYNLLDNALKYSPTEPNIEVKLKEENEKVMVSVQDRGLGIAEEFKGKIFEKFFRVPSGDVHNIKGYGLGLSYVDSVVKSHHGNIDVQSEAGKGSTFTITLPKIS